MNDSPASSNRPYRTRGAFAFARHVGWGLAWAAASAELGAGDGDYAAATPTGQIAANQLAEISGIVASRRNPGVLWIHNDRARDTIFAVDAAGSLLATWKLGGPVSDMEDIAIGPGPRPDLEYLYCGDIGDNAAVRSGIRVYRAAEPAVYPYQAEAAPTEDFPVVERFDLTYPDGAHNAEALLVDPWTGDLLVATKERGLSRIYRALASQLADGAKIVLTPLAQVAFDIVSAGDISPDGREILLRQEDFARVWRRVPGQTLADALAEPPLEVPVVGTPTEPNGEGVAFAPDGAGYFTISEGETPMLYFFAKTNGVRTATLHSLVPPASEWKYLDDGRDPGAAWPSVQYQDGTWKTGQGQFGYGEDDQRTRIEFGPDPNAKYVTTFFRKAFEVAGARRFESLVVRAVWDDGIAVYLNGDEVFRSGLAPGVGALVPATTSGSDGENLWHQFEITASLREGTNVIAAEVHRFSRSEADLSFDLQLMGRTPVPRPRFASLPRLAAGGGWTVEVVAEPGDWVDVERSSDLRSWTTVASVVPARGEATVTLQPDSATRAFFRLRAR